MTEAAPGTTFSPAAGDLVVARNRKWDGTPHWVVPGSYLGADQIGHWIHQPAGSFVSKPGSGFIAESPAVLLVPYTGEWVATFYDAEHPDGCTLYVDLVTDIAWGALERNNGWELTLIDMDLDVITARGRTWVDDEDEFAEHQVRYGYPVQMIDGIQAECDRVYAAVLAGEGPFDGRAERWLERALALGTQAEGPKAR